MVNTNPNPEKNAAEALLSRVSPDGEARRRPELG